LPKDLCTAIKMEAFTQSKCMSPLIHQMLQYHFIDVEEKPIKK